MAKLLENDLSGQQEKTLIDLKFEQFDGDVPASKIHSGMAPVYSSDDLQFSADGLTLKTIADLEAVADAFIAEGADAATLTALRTDIDAALGILQASGTELDGAEARVTRIQQLLADPNGLDIADVNQLQEALDSNVLYYDSARATAGKYSAGDLVYDLAGNIRRLNDDKYNYIGETANTSSRAALLPVEINTLLLQSNNSNYYHSLDGISWENALGTVRPKLEGDQTVSPEVGSKDWEFLGGLNLARTVDELEAMPVDIGAVYLHQGHRETIYQAVLGDQTAKRLEDPNGIWYKPAGNDSTGASGVWERVTEHKNIIEASWLDGWRDDNDNANSGTDMAPLIQQLIDFCEPVEKDYVIGGTVSHEKKNNYTIKLHRTKSGSGRFLIGSDITIPFDKGIIFVDQYGDNVVFDFINGAKFVVLKGGQGRVAGIENMHLNGGVMQFIGGMQGHGLLAKKLTFMQSPSHAIHMIDAYDFDRTAYPSQASNLNVNFFHAEDLEFLACNGSLHLQATTYAKNRFTKLRTYGAKKSAIKLDGCRGHVLEDLEFIALRQAEYQNEAFIHFDTSNYDVDDITINEVRFGAEDVEIPDENDVLEYYGSPRQHIMVGDGTGVYNGGNKINNVLFNDMKCFGPNAANPSSTTHPTDYLINLQAPHTNVTIKNTTAQSIKESIVYEGGVVALAAHRGNNLIDVKQPSTRVPVFSHGGFGWDDVRSVTKQWPDAASKATIANNNDLINNWNANAASMTVAQDAADPFGVANNAWTLTKVDAAVIATIASDPTSSISGSAHVGVWARSDDAVKLAVRLDNDVNGALRLYGSGDTFEVTSEWTYYAIPLTSLGLVASTWFIRLYLISDTANDTMQVFDPNVLRGCA